MPRLSCRELGGDCEYIVEAGTTDAVKQELLAHVIDVHRRRVSLMSQDERDALDVRIDQALRRSLARPMAAHWPEGPTRTY